MKQAIFSLCCSLLIIAMVSCRDSAQSKAIQDAKDVHAFIKEYTPGTVPTTQGGYTMTLKMHGKEWIANAMMPPEASGRILGYRDGEYIGFPFYRRDMVVGKVVTFSRSHPVDIETVDDGGLYSGWEGSMEVTKVDEKFAEGTFHFTATSVQTDKTFEGTDGFFRISLQEPH